MKKFLLLAFLLSGFYAFAGDWYVANNGAGRGTSWADATNNLQGAVTKCANGSTVWVSNGTYVVNLTVGAGVTVRSKTGLPADVILNGNHAGRVVAMDTGSWLMGCTVTNGYLENDGGAGVRFGAASNCIITGNVTLYGGGQGAGGYQCAFYNCKLIGNYTQGASGGGGYQCAFYNCELIGNESGGDFGGGGYQCGFYNSTISGNNGVEGGGGYQCTFINSISWGNNNVDNFLYGGSESYSCGVGYTGVGSITNDPQFVSSSDFHLRTNSPCWNTGNNFGWAGLSASTDLDGKQRIWPVGDTVDMGAYEYGGPVDPVYPVYCISIN